MDALTAARERLAARIKQPQVLLVPGLKDDLQAIARALAEIAQRLHALEIAKGGR